MEEINNEIDDAELDDIMSGLDSSHQDYYEEESDYSQGAFYMSNTD